jgi:hypothetical protein
MGGVNTAFMMVTLVDSSRRRDIWQVIDGVHPRRCARSRTSDV